MILISSSSPGVMLISSLIERPLAPIGTASTLIVVKPEMTLFGSLKDAVLFPVNQANITPKIRDSPAATRNSEEALASPLRNWMRTDDKSID